MDATRRPFYLSVPLPLRLAVVGVVWLIAYQALPAVTPGHIALLGRR